jgi:hypothetical protein
MKKKPTKNAAPAIESKPSGARGAKSSGGAGPKPGVSSPKSRSSKKLEISPLARQALLSAARPTPVGEVAGGKRKLSKQQVDTIRQFAVAMAQDDLRSDEATVLICNRISEPPAIPLTELLYDTCRWCAADIYYDRLMPNPPDIVRVCVPCGIMLLEADKKGRN